MSKILHIFCDFVTLEIKMKTRHLLLREGVALVHLVLLFLKQQIIILWISFELGVFVERWEEEICNIS